MGTGGAASVAHWVIGSLIRHSGFVIRICPAGSLLLHRGRGFGFEVFDFFPEEEALGGAHAVEDECAVEVVGFVLPDAGEEVGIRFFEGGAVEGLGFDVEGEALGGD